MASAMFLLGNVFPRFFFKKETHYSIIKYSSKKKKKRNKPSIMLPSAWHTSLIHNICIHGIVTCTRAYTINLIFPGIRTTLKMQRAKLIPLLLGFKAINAH